MIRSDTQKTCERIHRLEEYVRVNLLDEGRFVCSNFQECRASRGKYCFYEGQLSHVGRLYDLDIDGSPTRIVVVGQEYGTGETGVGLELRSRMLAESAAAGFRGRNPHMRGTTSLLRLLLGRSPGSDPDGERLIGGHIFDGFALVNFLLCTMLDQPRGAYDGGAGKGKSSPTMRRNCSHHFLRTLEILEPTVIVVQGQGVHNWIKNNFSLHDGGIGRECLRIRGVLVELLTFDHPSAGGKSGWWGRCLTSRYFQEIVSPNIASFLAARHGLSV